MKERLVKTSLFIDGTRFSVEPDEEVGTMEFFAEQRDSNGEVENYIVATLTLDEMEYLAKSILDAVKFERNRIDNRVCRPDLEEVLDFVEDDEQYPNSSKEKLRFISLLSKHNGDRKAAAKELGISDRTLYRKLKFYNIV